MADEAPSIVLLGQPLDPVIEWHLSTSERAAEAIWNLCILVGAVLVVIVSAQVFTRYLLGFVPLWGGELARYLGIWLALMLMGALVRVDRHLQVEIVFRRFSRRARRYIRSIQLGLIVVLGWLLVEWGLVYALRSGTGQMSPSLGIEMFWVYLVLPFSGLLLMYFASAKLIEINYDPETLDQDYQARFRFDEDLEGGDSVAETDVSVPAETDAGTEDETDAGRFGETGDGPEPTDRQEGHTSGSQESSDGE